MLVKQMIYILSLLIFVFSVFNLIYSIKNKNRDASKYIIILSIIFILYSIVDILILPNALNLDVGFEMFLFFGVLAVSNILFIISIILNIKRKKLNTIGKSIKYKLVFVFLIFLPILMFCLSYFREMNYINNSKLILVCSDGDGFSEENYAYAISEDYSEMITIGVDFRGYVMKKHLPNSFYELDYTWSTDEIEINDDKIIIFRNNEVIYKINLANKISYCDIEEVFYKQK